MTGLVGVVVLVGLACKNAILIVEFAKQRHEAGADRRTAALEAWQDAGLESSGCDPEKCGVIVGSGIGSLAIIEKCHGLWLQSGTKKFSPFMIPMLM